MSSVKVTVLGGGNEIGGSSYLIEGSKRVLVDCGARFAPISGSGVEPHRVKVYGDVDLALFTHHHFDHIGCLPNFAAEHPEALLFMSAPALAASWILWQDRRKIARQNYVKSPFSALDQHSAFNRLKRNALSQPGEVEIPIDGVRVWSWADNHSFGACGYAVKIDGKVIGFSGDSCRRDHILQSVEPLPTGIPFDAFFLESTNGGVALPNPESEMERFIGRVRAVVARGGTALIPTVSGKGVEILATLIAAGIPTAVDGMTRKMLDCAVNHTWASEKEINNFRHLTVVGLGYDSHREFVRNVPGAIVTTAGTMEWGPAPFYFEKVAATKKDALFFIGYLFEDSASRKIVFSRETMSGKQLNFDDEIEMRLEGEARKIQVGCEVEHFLISSHLSQSDAIFYAKQINSNKIFLYHGESQGQKILRDKIMAAKKNTQVEIAENGRVIEI